MHLALESHDSIETFFKAYLSDPSLQIPRLSIHRSWLFNGLARLVGIEAITYRRYILLADWAFSRVASGQITAPADLVAHEVTHVLQYRQRGTIRFLSTYLLAFAQGLKVSVRSPSASLTQAYLRIPDEIAARDAARAFLHFRKSGSA
jgi:hypothetical protein